MLKRRKTLLAILAVVTAIMLSQMAMTKEIKTALCMSLIGPRVFENAEISVSEGQITVNSKDSPVKMTMPIDACMVITERQ